MSKDREYYKPDDMCYVVDNGGKIKYSEVVRVITEVKEYDIVYQLRDLVDYRYFVAPHENCWDSESEAKKYKASTFKKDEVKIKRRAKKR